MNTAACQEIQRRLLETEAGGLTAAETDHLRACPDCRAFAREVRGPGQLFASIARQVERQEATTLPPGLKARVRQQIRDHTTQTDSGGALSAKAAPRGGRNWREALSEIVIGWRWAAVTGMIVMAASFATIRILQNRPIGTLVFADGPTSLRTASLVQQHQGVGQWDCQRGATLSTPDNAAARFSVGEGAQAVMDKATTLQVVDRERIALVRGSVWLHVTPGGKGFKVETPFALVQVTGTQYGVTVTDRETRVEVAKGSVAVSRGQDRNKVSAGQAMTAGAGGLSALVARAEGTSPPGWVSRLLAAEKLARAGAYLPSIGKRK